MAVCCLAKDKISHEEEEIYTALGLSSGEKDLVNKVVREALEKRRISEMLEHIWVEKCSELSLEARIYATLRLGMDIYSLLLETTIARLEGEVDKAGKSGSKTP